MAYRVHIPLMLAGLAMTGAAGAWAQDNSGNPWRVAPRATPSTNAADDERGFTQGYLRGFEQGYRRGAEQATGGAPTANLGPPSATGSTGRGNGVLSDTPPAGLTPAPHQSPAVPPNAALAPHHDHGSDNRAFTPKPSQWGEYPPLDLGRPANPSAALAPRYPVPGAQPAAPPPYPYASPPAPQQPAYAQPYAQPYAAAPQPYPYGGYGYPSPYAGGPSTLMPGAIGPGGPYGPGAYGPSTLGTPFGGSPLPGMPGMGGPGFGVW